MDYEPETPFDSIESAQQFLELLGEAVEEARREVEEQIAQATAPSAEQRKQMLQLVAHKLVRLNTHLTTSRRILGDLHNLRGSLLEEPRPEAHGAGRDGSG